MQATDSRSYDMSIVQEEEENEQRGLFSPPIIERLFPVLAGAICFFHVIVRFKIDRFDQFDHSDAPDPIGFSAHLMIGVGVNEGVEESTSALGVQETTPDAVEQEETPFNDPPILVPEPLSVRPPLVSADARENEPDADNTDPVDDLAMDVGAMLSENFARNRESLYEEDSLDSGDEADNDNSSPSEDDRRSSAVGPTRSPETNRRFNQLPDTRNNDNPSDPLPVAPVGRLRRKSRHRSTTIRELESSSS